MNKSLKSQNSHIKVGTPPLSLIKEPKLIAKIPRKEVRLNPQKLAELVPSPWLDFLPGPTKAEHAILAKSNGNIGTIHPVVVCGNVLLDGRTRVKEALANQQSLNAVDFFNATPEQQLQIVLALNFGRTHLTKGQRAMVAVDLIGAHKRKKLSQRKAATMVGLITQPLVCQAMKLGKTGDTEVIQEVRSGDLDVYAALRKIREKNLRNQFTELASKNPAIRVELRGCDFKIGDADIADASADAIITDPLYAKSYRSDWDELFKFAARVLKPGSVLVTMMGSLALSEFMETANRYKEVLPYLFNAVGLITKGPSNSHRCFKVHDKKRDYLIFVKATPKACRPRTINGSPTSVLELEGPDTTFSPYGQRPSAFAPFIEWYTNPGDLVIDPFTGGGAVPAACQQLGRRCIAFEKDKTVFNNIVGRFFGKAAAEIALAQSLTTVSS